MLRDSDPADEVTAILLDPAWACDKVKSMRILDLITSNEAGNYFSIHELYQLCENTDANKIIRCEAYFILLRDQPLAHLVLLNNYVDFSYFNKFGNAFEQAACHGRIDVMQWLHQNAAQFKFISMQSKIRIILNVVYHNQINVLRVLREPFERGGFGWNIDVRNGCGMTTIDAAVNGGAENVPMLLELINPVEKGGCGLRPTAEALDVINSSHAYSMVRDDTGAPGIYYKSRNIGRKKSSVEIRHQDGSVETFDDYRLIGYGRSHYGRLFRSQQNGTHELIVKRPLHVLQGQDNRQPVNVMREVKALTLMQKAYSGRNHYGFRWYVNENTLHQDARIVMPFNNGMTLDRALSTGITPREYAYIVLAILTEIHRLHQLNIIVCAIHWKDIFLEMNQDDAFITLPYKASFTKLSSAHDKDALVSCSEIARGQYSAPELTVLNNKIVMTPMLDVFSIAKILTEFYALFLQSCHPEFYREIGVLSPLCDFTINGIAVDPAERPDLPAVINGLREALNNQEVEMDVTDDNVVKIRI